MKMFMFALLLTSFKVFAVETAKCPESISVNVGSLDPVSDAKLKQLETDGAALFSFEEMQAARNVVSANWKSALTKRTFKIVSKKNSVCTYGPEAKWPRSTGNRNDLGDGETRFFTRNGKNILRVAVLTGTEIVWLYYAIESYSTDGLKAKAVTATPVYALFDHGSPHVGVAWAKESTVK